MFHDGVWGRYLEAAVGRRRGAQHGTHTQLHLRVQKVVEHIVEEEVLGGDSAGWHREAPPPTLPPHSAPHPAHPPAPAPRPRTSMVLGTSSARSSWVRAASLALRALASSLTTCSRVLPSGGARLPHVVRSGSSYGHRGGSALPRTMGPPSLPPCLLGLPAHLGRLKQELVETAEPWAQGVQDAHAGCGAIQGCLGQEVQLPIHAAKEVVQGHRLGPAGGDRRQGLCVCAYAHM